jgi:hypothetical protein
LTFWLGIVDIEILVRSAHEARESLYVKSFLLAIADVSVGRRLSGER